MRHSAGAWSGKTSEVPQFSLGGTYRRIHAVFWK